MLYVFLGAREPRIHDEARIALGLADAEDLSLTRLDGADTSLVAVAEACGAIDMFGGRRKVLLSNAQALVASNKKVLDWLAAFAGAGSDAPCDLAVLAYLDLGDRRSRSRVQAFMKLEAAGAQVRQVRPLDERRAAQFAQRLAQRRGVRLEDAAAERLVEIVTPDAGLLAREVDKLAAYAGFSGTLGMDDVDAASATIGEHQRWDYINAVSAQQPRRALGVLHDLLGLRAPRQMILADIGTAIRRLATAKAVQDAGGDAQEVARRAGVPPYRARELHAQARRTSPRLLERMYGEVVRTDRALKSTGSEEDALLEILTARLATRPGRR